MADETMTLELGPAAVERINRLRSIYREKSSEALVARALGLMELLEPYLEDGTLLVVDPNAPPQHDLIQLEFENVSGAAHH